MFKILLKSHKRPLNFLGEKNSQKYFLEKKSRRNCFGGFDSQFLRFGEKISEKKSFSLILIQQKVRCANILQSKKCIL